MPPAPEAQVSRGDIHASMIWNRVSESVIQIDTWHTSQNSQVKTKCCNVTSSLSGAYGAWGAPFRIGCYICVLVLWYKYDRRPARASTTTVHRTPGVKPDKRSKPNQHECPKALELWRLQEGGGRSSSKPSLNSTVIGNIFSMFLSSANYSFRSL